MKLGEALRATTLHAPFEAMAATDAIDGEMVYCYRIFFLRRWRRFTRRAFGGAVEELHQFDQVDFDIVQRIAQFIEMALDGGGELSDGFRILEQHGDEQRQRMLREFVAENSDFRQVPLQFAAPPGCPENPIRRGEFAIDFAEAKSLRSGKRS